MQTIPKAKKPGTPRMKPPSRLRLALSVLRYALRHPFSVWRNLSWYRLRRLAIMFLASDGKDLSLLIKQRFPLGGGASLPRIKLKLGQELDGLELQFDAPAIPVVSIIVPVHNKYRMTMYCLRSLLENTHDMSYEVIIADDASTDLTMSIDERVRGVKLVRNKDNQGFLHNCNGAADLARGDYLLFLNNDTAFTPGWLSELVSVLDADNSVAVCGPMLLFGSGKLQEAGGIVWNDGSAWNYGRESSPMLPAYNYRREVDYVSGACLLVRRSVWSALGGFDERYAPAYYEDTDLCFAARAAGHRVMYQPRAKVYHFEGFTHGRSYSTGIKAHQATNQKKFRAKWQKVLESGHFPHGKQMFLARDRSRHRRTVVVIDQYVPFYDKDAGSRSTWMYLQLMVEMGYNVKFIGGNFQPHQPYTDELQDMGVEVLVGERVAHGLKAWLRDNAASIDVIYTHRPHIAEQLLKYFEAMEPRPRLLYFGHDLHFLRVQREYEVVGDKRLLAQAEQWKARELNVAARMDKVYYPSQVEVDMLTELVPHIDAKAIPVYVLDEVESVPYDWAGRKDILFVAGFNHTPNVDGLCWLVDEIMPLVWKDAPNLCLHVVGSNPLTVVKSLASDRVVIHGYLSDQELRRRYAQARVAVAPLRFGAGVKGKVVEALQNGLPLVTTHIGAEGLPEPEQVFQVEDSAEGFARALLAVERGEQSVLEKLANYTGYLKQHFSKRKAKQILLRDFGDPQIERRFD